MSYAAGVTNHESLRTAGNPEAVSSSLIKGTGRNEGKSKAAAALFRRPAWQAMIPAFVAIFVEKGNQADATLIWVFVRFR